MSRTLFGSLGLGLAALALLVSSALGAVTFDPATGTGFVGKGDVQDVFGWNNRTLQDNAGDVRFQAVSEVVTEVIWICTNTNNEQTQERERTTTTSIEGVVSSIARERNQITGFILAGYDGDPTVDGPETDGPALNSCPSGPWVLTTPAGDPELVEGDGVQIQVSNDGGVTWHEL